MKLFLGLGALAVAVIFIVMQLVAANNYAVRAEREIQGTWENNQNILANYTTKIAEMAQIPKMQKKALQDVLQTAFEARYGAEGSQAAMQWIQEAYPGTLDNTLYQRLMETMDAGRTEFKNNQTTLIDRKREYETQLETYPRALFLKIAGFPKKDLSKFNVVLSTSAKESFATGIDDGVKLDAN